MLLLAFVVGFAAVSAEPSQICREAFYKSGLSTNYNETIAHAVHSMSVEGLRLFDPMASEQNKIPTVNQDLSQDQKAVNWATQGGCYRLRKKSQYVLSLISFFFFFRLSKNWSLPLKYYWKINHK